MVLYLVINAGLWAVWAIGGAETDDLWPAWVRGIWAIFLVWDAVNAFGERPISDQQIEKEMRRLRGR